MCSQSSRRYSFSCSQKNKHPECICEWDPLGGEGMGSVLQHFKQSIVLSQVLDSSLHFGWNEVWDHRYSQSEIYNANAESQTLNVTKACRVQDFIPHEDRDAVVRGWCAGEDSAIARLDDVKTRMADCTGILDTEVDEVRWGDTAPLRGTDISTHDFYGSMNFPDIARILADLRAFSSNPLEITIAMEEADRAVIALLNLEAGEYTLLDSPQTQALDDLRVLSRSDVFVIGGVVLWGVDAFVGAAGVDDC
ncbi:hypothetical protein R3P38DRAFT_2762310 [Favolaschia claudopus]|uniref:Uncharacterized protein n=1 Tax=Favolaschia claudopus TaxID=2862362 RepID=A0AAW0DJ25_9AGAR